MMGGGTPLCRYFAEKLATISRLPRSSTWWTPGLPESPAFFSLKIGCTPFAPSAEFRVPRQSCGGVRIHPKMGSQPRLLRE
jgi:hypothetical protein